MPLSPASADSAEDLSSYQSSWQAIESLVHQGKSWSGRERHCAYLNLGTNRMANVSAVTGLDYPEDGRSLAVTDWDRDGDLDLWLGHRTGPRLRLLLNQTGQGPSPPPHVSFLLQGTQCNRDAIGARLTLQFQDGSRQIQTVQAGDAYLSQSSGILHFGMGDHRNIVRVSIRWPGGPPEEFSGVRPNHRHLAVQGTGTLVATPAETGRSPAPDSTTSVSPVSPAPTSSRTVLSHPLPMPGLAYEAWNEAARGLPRPARPLLINLWASWCAPCLVELREWSRQEETVRQAGFDILALNVDPLDPRGPGAEAAARRLLERMDFPFASGAVDSRWLEKMDLLSDLLFDLHADLAIPTSFLVDSNQNLCVLYRGTLTMESLRKDLAQLSAPAEVRRREAVPFAGRWASPPGEPLYERMAARFQESFPEEAERYLQLALRNPTQPSARPNTTPGIASDPQQSALQLNLILSQLRQNKVEEATESLRELLMSNPELPDAWLVFAEIARLRQRPVEAGIAYRKVLELAPNLHHVADRLARMLATHPDPRIRDGKEAVTLARRACAGTGYKVPEFIDTLAAALAEAGQFDQAVATMKQALSMIAAKNNGVPDPEMKKRLSLYQQKEPFHEGPVDTAP